MAQPVHVETFPLIVEVDKAHKLNYFYNARKPDWDISREKEPINLWQPNVEPGPNGGKIINEPFQQRKKKSDFNVVSRRPALIPNQQDWCLSTGTGETYTLQCNESSIKGDVIMTPKPGRFVISFIADDFKATEDRKERDAEECEREMEKNIAERIKKRSQISSEYVKAIEEEERLRKEKIKDELKTGSLILMTGADGFEDADNVGDEEIRAYAKQAKKELGEEADIDFDLDRSDDDLEHDSDFEESEKIHQNELNQLFEHGLLDEDEDEDIIEQITEKKKDDESKPVAKSLIPEGDVPKTITQIVEAVSGPRCVKRAEFVRFFLDNGQVTPHNLIKRFQEYAKTDEQKEVLKKLIVKNCKKIDKNGITYYQLRAKSKIALNTL